jgi:hypothetical protein
MRINYMLPPLVHEADRNSIDRVNDAENHASDEVRLSARDYAFPYSSASKLFCKVASIGSEKGFLLQLYLDGHMR